MREVAREIIDLVSKIVCPIFPDLHELSIDRVADLQMDVVVAPPVSPSQPSSGHGSPSSPDQFKAPDIALSLTVIEGERYAEISQADYVAHLRGATSTHIESATKVNNRLVNWVKQNILGLVGSFFFSSNLR